MSERFLTFCRLTCVGGSERGTCPCSGPTDCQMKTDPAFEAWRKNPRQQRLRCLPSRYEIVLENAEDDD